MDWMKKNFDLVMLGLCAVVLMSSLSGCASVSENRISTEEFNPETGQVYRDEVYQRSKAGAMGEVQPMQDTEWIFQEGLRMQQQGTLNNTAQAGVYELVTDVVGETVRAVLESLNLVPGKREPRMNAENADGEDR